MPDPNQPETADERTAAAWLAGWDYADGEPPGRHGTFVDALRPVFMSKPLGLLARLDWARLATGVDGPVSPGPGAAAASDVGPRVDVVHQLAAALAQEGYVEGPGNDQPFGAWQGVRNAAWCDSFAQWAAVLNGGWAWPAHCQFGDRGDAYCPYTEEHAEELGLAQYPLFVPPPGPVPPGWQVLYSWGRNEWCDHIGTVVRQLDNGNLLTIEGNYRDSVALVERDWSYIRTLVTLPTAASPDPDGPFGPPPPVQEDQLALTYLPIGPKTTITIPMPPAQRSGGLPWGGVFVNLVAGDDPEPSDDDYAVRVQINRNDGQVRGVVGQSDDGLVHLAGRRKFALEVGPGDESVTVYNPGGQSLLASVEAMMLA